jgi:hypothetical protein
MVNSSIFGKDTPMGCPDVNERAGVFVPAAGHEKELPPNIKNGAGIVGYGNNDGTLMIYFESNRFDESKLQTWLSKVRLSYDRMVQHAPTTSHVTIVPDAMEQIGLIDGSGIEITKPESLNRWLAYCHAQSSAPAKLKISWGH